MITDHRCDAHAVAGIYAGENGAYHRDDAICRNTALTDIAQQLEIVQDADNGDRDRGKQLGRAVQASSSQKAQLRSDRAQSENAAVPAQKIAQRNDARKQHGDRRRSGSSGDTPASPPGVAPM